MAIIQLNGGGASIQEIAKALYPIGSIYMSTSSTNPGAYLGGTWAAWGSGRVPVGINTADTDFSTIEKTGGSKTSYVEGDGQRNSDSGTNWVNQGLNVNTRTFSVLQPYIVCYMWKRTA